MARFRLVYVYPPTGFPERLQNLGESTPVQDAYIRSSRSVTWLYTEALRGTQAEGRRSELRLRIDQPTGVGTTSVRLAEWLHEGPEWAFVTLPADADELDARERARVVLEAVHTAVHQLCELHGWDPMQFEACRRHVLQRDFVYRWESPWKSAPDRRHRARATFVLGPEDGFGRVRLEVAGRDSDEVVAHSGEAIAYSTQPGFERSAKTLRWHGKGEVRMRPYGDTLTGSGEIVGRLGEDGWAFEVSDEVTVRQPTPTMDLADVPLIEKSPKSVGSPFRAFDDQEAGER